jgi:hypothetical protein
LGRWRQISIREEYYKVIKDRAKKNRRTIAGELEWILIESKIVKPIQREDDKLVLA